MTTVIKSKNKEYHFYDTSALLEKSETLFNEEENIITSTIVLKELENIKTSRTKSEDIKHSARLVINKLANNSTKYTAVIYSPKMLKPLYQLGLLKKNEEPNNDLKILSCAIWYDKYEHPDETYFYTNDLSLFNIANLFFGEDSIRRVKEKIDNYKGYRILKLSEQEIADLYSNQSTNFFNQNINEYLIINDNSGKYIDTLCWTEAGYRPLKYKILDSKMFGKIKPIANDYYQACAIDSMLNNQITLIKGPAGTGKSYLALGYLMHLLEKGKIDKIIIFCNTIATKNSARLGFYPGSKDEKLLDSQIGNFLASKLGDKTIVERMI
jgi:predicted ribonuclease YlaK